MFLRRVNEIVTTRACRGIAAAAGRLLFNHLCTSTLFYLHHVGIKSVCRISSDCKPWKLGNLGKCCWPSSRRSKKCISAQSPRQAVIHIIYAHIHLYIHLYRTLRTDRHRQFNLMLLHFHVRIICVAISDYRLLEAFGSLLEAIGPVFRKTSTRSQCIRTYMDARPGNAKLVFLSKSVDGSRIRG